MQIQDRAIKLTLPYIRIQGLNDLLNFNPSQMKLIHNSYLIHDFGGDFLFHMCWVLKRALSLTVFF